MTELSASPFRTTRPADAIANDSVVPYYPGRPRAADRDRTSRRSPLRVRRPVHTPALSALRRPAQRHDDHVPVPRIPVRHRQPGRSSMAQRRPTERLRRARGRRRHSGSGMTETPDTAVQDEQRTQTKLAVGAMLVPLFFAIMFATCIIGTLPQAASEQHQVRRGRAGGANSAAARRAREGGRLDLRHQRRHDGRPSGARRPQRNLNAAFVPSVEPEAAGDRDRRHRRRSPRRGGGRDPRPFGRRDTGCAAHRARRPSTDLGRRDRPRRLHVHDRLHDLRVSRADDPRDARSRPAAEPPLPDHRRRPPSSYRLLVYLIGGLGFGTFTGSVGTILAFIGVGALYTLLIGLGTRLLQVLLGPLAIFVSLAIFVFLNIASLGATYTTTMLPPFWRFLNHFWIGASAVNAERSLLYFDGLGVATDMLRLLAWTGLIVALLLLPASQKLEARRLRARGRRSCRVVGMHSARRRRGVRARRAALPATRRGRCRRCRSPCTSRWSRSASRSRRWCCSSSGSGSGAATTST